MRQIIGKNFLLMPGNDGLNIGSNTRVCDCTVKIDLSDPRHKSIHHWDWLQIIARILGFDNRQYAAAKATCIRIINNIVDGRSSVLQCIFSMDGYIDDIIVKGNTLGTAGEHYITLAGVRSGEFVDNFDFEGVPVAAILEPLTIAGVIHVLSFQDKDDEYSDCYGLFIDNRRKRTEHPDHVDLVDFDLKGFTQYVADNIPAKGSAEKLLPLIKDAAFLFGNVLTDDEEVTMDKKVISAESEDTKILHPSELARDLIILAEGKRNTIYRDKGGDATIGIGHKLNKEELATGTILIGGKPISTGSTLTDAEVNTLYEQDITERVTRLNKLLNDAGVSLSQYQFDSLFDFYFNIGYGNFVESTVWRRIKQGELDGVPEAMSWWKYDTVTDPKTGKRVKQEQRGLVARRKRGGLLWMNTLSKEEYHMTDYPEDNLEYNNDRPPHRDYRGHQQPPLTAPTSAPPAPPIALPEQEASYHESELDSSTIRNIYYMVASFLASLIVTNFGLPEVMQQVMTDQLASIITIGASLIFAKKARTGRLTASKGFRKN